MLEPQKFYLQALDTEIEHYLGYMTDKDFILSDPRVLFTPMMSDEEGGDKTNGDDPGTGIATRARTRTKRPSMYRVLLLNDDYTPMEFVVYVLERYFNKSREQATEIMLHVHNHGVGVCGVFTFEVAETKVAQVLDLARRNEHPLQCTMEKED
nr:ATP-dependent Clp protease adapter ClpS [Ponticaulis sp.]|tara:strand:+ start:150931 stop:151389 length:459 start_codon:yes stop_codon:yes gene_type:complete